MKALSLNQPHAIIMVGVTGSGKSTFAVQFSDTFSAPLISADALVEHGKDLQSASFLALNYIDQLAKTKQLFIIDGLSDTTADRKMLYDKLKKLGYKPFVVWVQTDPQLVKSRLSKLGATDNDIDGILDAHQAPKQDEVNAVISGRHTYGTQARGVLRKISQPRAAAAAATKPTAASRPDSTPGQRRVTVR